MGINDKNPRLAFIVYYLVKADWRGCGVPIHIFRLRPVVNIASGFLSGYLDTTYPYRNLDVSDFEIRFDPPNFSFHVD